MAVASYLTREKLLEIAHTLPAAAKVLARLGEIIRDVNADMDTVASLIKRDAALTARIIRISNSVVYGSGGQRVGAIEEAVNRVGFSEVYRLVGLVTGSQLTDRPLKFYGVEMVPLREHILFTALACEALAEPCGLDVRSAYTVGLMRTLGMLVLDRVAERLPSIEMYDHARFGGYPVWEGIAFGFSNSEVAALILNDWRFPVDAVAAVREHHLLRGGDYENRLACLLNVAGQIVADNGHALPGDSRYWMLSPRKLDALGVNEEHLQAASVKALANFERLRVELH
jgi:HD-like signal output (HDOD) protein